MTTLTKFEGLIDYANKRSLAPHEGTRHDWVFITSELLTLERVAYAFYYSLMSDVERWTESDEIRFYKFLQEVPGNDYKVICFENFYFLKSVN